MHALACLVVLPWLYDGRAVALAVIGIFVFGQGINLGYHRLLTHRSLALPRWLERCFVVLAICCLQESPATWVAWHRAHHAHSDGDRDPHSPLVSFLWGHVIWLAFPRDADVMLGGYRRYAQDILQDRFYRRLEQQPALIYLIYLAPRRAVLRRRLRPRLGGGRQRCRRPATRPQLPRLGRDPAHGPGLAHHLVGQFADPSLRLSPLRDRRQQPQQLAGRPHRGRRGLAQQPPSRPGERHHRSTAGGSWISPTI